MSATSGLSWRRSAPSRTRATPGLAALLLMTTLVAAGCSPGTNAADSRIVSACTAHNNVPTDMCQAVAGLKTSYDDADWGAISQEVTDRKLRHELLRQMQDWQYTPVEHLDVGLVYARRRAPHLYIGTVRYTADPRVAPLYESYLFRIGGYMAHIAGSVSGISGTSFRTATWTVTRSAHFTLYHSPYLPESAARDGLDRLEQQRSAFERLFGVRVAPRIAYYQYPKVAMMARLTQKWCGAQPDNIGCTDPYAQPPVIQVTENWPNYHEPIHVYERALEPPPGGNGDTWQAPTFIDEGTAVALQDRQVDPRLSDYCSNLAYLPLQLCARQALRHVRPITLLSERGFDRADPEYAYSMAGSFVKYLILRQGHRAFGRFYHVLAAQPKDRIADYDVAARAVYRESMETLLGQWRAAVCGKGC